MNRQYGALSGAAIVLIAINHAIHYGFELTAVPGAWTNVLIFLQALGAFAVPAFLFISGAFLSYSAGQLSFQFIKTNLGRILWPYAVWSVLFFVLVFLTMGERYSPAGYIKNLLVGYPYHFIPLLTFWYLAAPFVVKAGKRYGLALVAAIAVYQSLLLLVRFPEWLGPIPAPWSHLLRVPVLFTSMSDWAIYFPLGLVLSMHNSRVKPILLKWRWALMAGTAVVFLLGILDAYKLISAPWARFAAPLPLMFLLPIVDRQVIPWVQRFEFLGKRSYGIYLAHFFVINLVVFFLKPLGLGPAALLVVVPGLLVIALAIPLALMDVMARPAITRKIYRYVFGFPPPPPVVTGGVAQGIPAAARS